MSTIRSGTQVIRKLSLRGQAGTRSYTHISQPLQNVEQPVVRQTQSQSKSSGWAVPAMLVLVGIGCSTFSTHQLVSGNNPMKMLSTSSPNEK